MVVLPCFSLSEILTDILDVALLPQTRHMSLKRHRLFGRRVRYAVFGETTIQEVVLILYKPET